MAVGPTPHPREPGHAAAPSPGASPLNLNVDALRHAVRAEYAEVATDPGKGFHFHTGRPLAALLGYDPRDVDPLPEVAVESFAGVGNPGVWGRLRPGETVVEVGSGAGLAELAALAGPLERYHLYHSTRAELLRGLGDPEAARAADRRALVPTANPAERGLLEVRLTREARRATGRTRVTRRRALGGGGRGRRVPHGGRRRRGHTAPTGHRRRRTTRAGAAPAGLLRRRRGAGPRLHRRQLPAQVGHFPSERLVLVRVRWGREAVASMAKGFRRRGEMDERPLHGGTVALPEGVHLPVRR
jgi:hypothetical protein